MNQKERFFNLIIAAVFFILLIVLSTLVHNDFFRNFDYFSMLQVQEIQSPAIDYIFSVFTLLGSSELILFFILIIFAILNFKIKKPVLAPWLYILIYPLEILGKLIVYHPKPPVFLNRYVFEFHLPSSFIIETSYSYPSGHMARTAFLISLLLLFIRKSGLNKNRKKLLFLLLSLYLVIMFVSRIYLGEHWFSDVLGGTLLGFVIARLSFMLW